MASFEVPIKVNLPDNWADIVVEKLKKDESICFSCYSVQELQMVWRCWMRNQNCR